VFPLHILSVDSKGQILGHNTILVDDFNAGSLQVQSKLAERLVIVELGAVEQAAGPGEDRGDGVGAGLVTLLIFTIMPSDSSVSGLTLDNLAVGGDELRGHHSKTSESLGEDVTLHVTIVIFACPDESS